MSDLYDTDFHEWAETQAALLRRRAANMLDWDNLAEEIESLAKSDEREVASRLLLICQHLLKWEYQPGRRTINWRSAIRVNRRDLGKLLSSKTDALVSDRRRPRLFADHSVDRPGAGDRLSGANLWPNR
jgi:hypothetical protein